ncbi:MAG: glucuronate isomerase [Actinomycetes bacterium]
MPAPRPLQPHPDRLLPADPSTRSVARRLYEQVRDLPILSPHGHVDARRLARDEPFTDPAALLVQPDHYVTRLLHASGVPLDELGVGAGPLGEVEARRAWRHLCEHWHVFRGTPVRTWLETELHDLFGVTEQPSGDNADELYDHISAQLAEPDFRPRALFARFGIEVLATTDDPCDDLDAHAALRDDPTFPGRVLPTFRPDRYLDLTARGWAEAVQRLGEVTGEPVDSVAGYLRALQVRRAYFVEHGAVSADHGVIEAGTDPLEPNEAIRIYDAALRGAAAPADAAAFGRHVLLEMARMSTEDGLVMTIHPGVLRNHHGPTLQRVGPDSGHDIPVAAEYTRSLRPLLERFGTHPALHLVLFTVDETLYSREIAPLAGFYPSVYVGVPWWFLDAPDAIARFQAAVTETAGFSRLSGFIDDTRAFCSIPARHDMARRLDAAHLARLVVTHRLDEDEAHDTLVALVSSNPRKVFKL